MSSKTRSAAAGVTVIIDFFGAPPPDLVDEGAEELTGDTSAALENARARNRGPGP